MFSVSNNKEGNPEYEKEKKLLEARERKKQGIQDFHSLGAGSFEKEKIKPWYAYVDDEVIPKKDVRGNLMDEKKMDRMKFKEEQKKNLVDPIVDINRSIKRKNNVHKSQELTLKLLDNRISKEGVELLGNHISKEGEKKEVFFKLFY